ncbi:MAG: exopolysaccharide biosynthesis protein [Methylotenera sp.]|nr:exopolysaccharide biosynthesis protein [Methylotenera sp.]
MTLSLGRKFLVPVLMGSTLTYMGLYTTTAFADKDDTFNIILDSHYEHDSNLFRLPDGQQPPNAERSDNIWDSNVGFSIDKDYSLQRFKFDYTHESVKYDNATFLNFEANNYFGAWLWAITPGLTGTLSTKRTTDLVPFLDYQTFNQNMRVTKEHIFNFDYSPHNVWHLVGGYSKLDVENSQPFIQQTSYKQNQVELGAKYTFPSNSYIMFKHKNRNGEQAESAFGLISSGFKEKEEELSAFWLISGKSKASANFGHVTRDDDLYSVRDFSGYFGGINYAWDITGKINLAVDISRRIASYQDQFSSYNTIDTLSIKPTWAITSKVSLTATALASKRKFLGDGYNTSPLTRVDSGVYYAIGADWTPRSTIKVGVALQHDVRNSNDFLDRDYSANIASIYGQLNF